MMDKKEQVKKTDGSENGSENGSIEESDSEDKVSIFVFISYKFLSIPYINVFGFSHVFLFYPFCFTFFTP